MSEPKKLIRSRTAWVTMLWGVINAMLLVLQSSMDLLRGEVPVITYIALNMAVSGALFWLRTRTTQPVTLHRS